MSTPEHLDEELAEELLGVLREDEANPPSDLEQRTLTKVRATITMRDLVDLTTIVFVLRFCAPLIDLIAAMFGAELTANDRREPDE
jgi:hypothetical protein